MVTGDAKIKMAFARRLRLLIRQAGLTQAEFIRLVQEQMPEHGRFQRGNLSSYLAGRCLPRPIVLHPMCRALNVRPDQLLPSSAKKAR